jgi:hypothetical protein
MRDPGLDEQLSKEDIGGQVPPPDEADRGARIRAPRPKNPGGTTMKKKTKHLTLQGTNKVYTSRKISSSMCSAKSRRFFENISHLPECTVLLSYRH